MSHTAHIPSHRKARRSAPRFALCAGVAGGVLSTLAVTGASGPANAAEPVHDTVEMPALTDGLATQVAASVDATQEAADAYATQALQNAAVTKAAKEARKSQAQAERKAEAKQKAEAARKAAEARASRSAERTTLHTESASSSVSLPSGSAGAVLSFLTAQLGDAYVMGGTGPNSWDCSGLVQAAFKQVGVNLPRTSQEQSTAGTQVPLSSVQPGDILYWGQAGSAFHVGVYIGNGQYLDAANPSKGVVVQDLSGYPASGAVRVL
ncbi:glycoside hydrolase [Streptomyces sulfonofaciens]|uniref:Glycoside hydrolase n=1 Tax=Streptomyces sulfonofaciens TaxID=68272 RepID=A0A919L0J3_9ACTN|nr:C40 family peptidase [Streptomyces sulfonofaciens]GHH78236.1 glycoside hydrolase [Streptomyces sulfonofaciens]